MTCTECHREECAAQTYVRLEVLSLAATGPVLRCEDEGVVLRRRVRDGSRRCRMKRIVTACAIACLVLNIAYTDFTDLGDVSPLGDIAFQPNLPSGAIVLAGLGAGLIGWSWRRRVLSCGKYP